MDEKSKIRKARIVGSSLVITIPPGWAEDGDLFSFKQGFDGIIIKIEEHEQPKEIHQKKKGFFGNFRMFK